MAAHWLYEAGIGEARAALVNDGAIRIAVIEPEGTLSVGTVLIGRIARLLPRRQAMVEADGNELLLAELPPGGTEGARITVVVTREAIAEPGRRKPPRCAATDVAPGPGADLLARIVATGLPVRRPAAHQPDAFEAEGWSEVLEEARGGTIVFSAGALRMTATPAMTLFDVDGDWDAEPLALAAAAAVGAAIVRHGIGGSIGIDFPTVTGKAPRQAIAGALDAALTAPPVDTGAFERTAVNGFGFLQVVRPRPRPSLPERLAADPVGAAARAALRRLERTPPGGTAAATLPPAVLGYLEARPAWLAELARRTGLVHRLEAQ